MKPGLKSGVKRLERLVHIRQTYVSVAEAAVKQAEAEVQRLEKADSELAGNIQTTQAGIAYLQTATAGRNSDRRKVHSSADRAA